MSASFLEPSILLQEGIKLFNKILRHSQWNGWKQYFNTCCCDHWFVSLPCLSSKTNSTLSKVQKLTFSKLCQLFFPTLFLVCGCRRWTTGSLEGAKKWVLFPKLFVVTECKYKVFFFPHHQPKIIYRVRLQKIDPKSILMLNSGQISFLTTSKWNHWQCTKFPCRRLYNQFEGVVSFWSVSSVASW